MNLKTIFALSVASMSLAACSVDEDAAKNTPVEETYTRDFIKTFGTINPKQDWNVMEKKSITVKAGVPTNVLIYEKQGNEYKLAANYKDVSGTQTITFDGMEGDNTPFIVSLNGNMVSASNGETVNYNGNSNSLLRGSLVPDEYKSWVSKSNQLTQITLNNQDKIFKNLEKNGVDNTDGTVDELDSYVDVLKAGQGTTYYPMYWNSPNIHEVGFYYYDNESSQTIKVPMFKDHEAGDIYYTAKDISEFYPNEAGQTESTQFSNTKKGDSDKNKWKADYFQGYTFKSYGYTIKPTKSIICGIYVKMNNDEVYYSDSDLNGGKNYFATRTVTNGDTYTYLCFDDPSDNGGEGDKDYNDLVFYTPRELSPVVRQDISCLVACEDLGGTFDYDFNDIVFRVYHVSGNDYLTIVPVAAGGQLKATLLYNGKEISEEWHQHFGDGHEYTDMINTGGTEETEVWPIRLKGIPTDFSMTQFSTSGNGGFSIRVERAGSPVTVTGPSAGDAPQMLILPYDWKWPVELTNIQLTYPKFGEWGSNYTDPSWVNTITDGKYIDMKESDFKQSKAMKEVTAE